MKLSEKYVKKKVYIKNYFKCAPFGYDSVDVEGRQEKKLR